METVIKVTVTRGERVIGGNFIAYNEESLKGAMLNIEGDISKFMQDKKCEWHTDGILCFAELERKL